MLGAVALVAAGCSSSPASSGSVSGRLIMGGGPAGNSTISVSGQVRFRSLSGGNTYTTGVDKSGKFSIDLPAGSY